MNYLFYSEKIYMYNNLKEIDILEILKNNTVFFILITTLSLILLSIDQFIPVTTVGFGLFTILFLGIVLMNRHSKAKLFIAIGFYLLVVIFFNPF